MAAPPAALAPHHAISPAEGATSAHNISRVQYSNMFEDKEATNLDDLFSNETTTGVGSCPQDWIEKLKSSLVDSSSELSMNASIQCLLNQSFPGNEGLSATNDWVTEEALSTMFGFEHGNGLPITMESRPDFCLRNNGRFILGEGKNHEDNSIERATRQNASYLLVNLYNQVVRRSKLPPAVYGIVVAGSRCFGGGGRFTVKLQQLSLPRTVGGRLQLRNLTLDENNGSLASVWEFLSRAIQVQDEDITFGMGCPALLQVPYKILRDGWADDVEMVLNGTACLVLKVGSYSGLVSLMELMKVTAKLCASVLWKEKDLNFPLYFKSKNYLLCNNPERQHYIPWVKMRRSDDLAEAFKVNSVPTGSGIYILVADLGLTVLEPTCQARDLKFSQLAEKYQSFMERIIEFEDYSGLYHGDIHVRNVTYWRGRFMLIDYDEACLEKVTERDPQTAAQMRLYPAALVNEPELYTKHQLMMTLQDILGLYRKGYEEAEYSGVGDFFQSYPGPDDVTPEIVGTKYETLVGLLLEECGQNADSSVRDVNAIGEDDHKRPSVARIPEALRDSRKKPRTAVESASPPVVVTAAPIPPAVELKPASVDEMVTGSAVEAVVAEAADEAVVTEGDVGDEGRRSRLVLMHCDQ